MIADREKNEIQSTMMGESVTMGIRAEDMAHIMDVLAGLYSNRLGAVLREYSTNALDAHIEAGFSGPVEVKLPSVMDPVFKVRDFGPGLDRDGIREVYSQYGRSTKRNSNDQVGMLGLGSKCALSYTSGFTVVSVKNGRRLTVLVSTDEEGAGRMQILGDPSGEPTQDANGTEIQVAIRREDIHRAEQQAAEFFSYWTPGTVTVNGRQPEHFTRRDGAHALRLTDDLWIVQGGGPSGDRVVMGSVAYPQEINVGIANRQWSLVAIVPIGSVRPVPSRESLKDTPQTKQTLSHVRNTFEKGITGAIQREVNAAATPADALRVVIEWAAYVPDAARQASAYTYQGAVLPATFTSKAPPQHDKYGGIEPPIEAVSLRYSYRKSDTRRYRDWPVKEWPTTIWVAHYAPEKFTAQHRNKLDKWMKDNNIGGNSSAGYWRTDGTVQHILLLREDAPDSPFIDKSRIVEWEVIKKIKLEPKQRVNGAARIPGSYDILTQEGYKHGVPGDKLDTSSPIFWLHGNRWEGEAYRPAISAHFKKFTIVCLPGNRVDKWKRDVPASKPVSEGVKTAFEAWKAAVPLDSRKALTMRDLGFIQSCKEIPAGVKDPELAEARRIARIPTDKLRDQRQAFRSLMHPNDLQVKGVTNPLNKYPLFQSRHASHKHTLIYLNAAYKAGV